jgi:hypothetical protein
MTARTRKTTAKSATRRSARTETAAKSTKAIGSSGLEGFAVHVGDTKRQAAASMRELRETTATAQARTRNANLLPTAQLDPETAARAYLDNAFAAARSRRSNGRQSMVLRRIWQPGRSPSR